MRALSPSRSPRFVRLAGVVAALLFTSLVAVAPTAQAEAPVAQGQPFWISEIRSILSQPAPVAKAVRAKQRQTRRLALRARKAARRQAIRDARHARSARSAQMVSRPTIR